MKKTISIIVSALALILLPAGVSLADSGSRVIGVCQDGEQWFKTEWDSQTGEVLYFGKVTTDEAKTWPTLCNYVVPPTPEVVEPPVVEGPEPPVVTPPAEPEITPPHVPTPQPQEPQEPVIPTPTQPEVPTTPEPPVVTPVEPQPPVINVPTPVEQPKPVETTKPKPADVQPSGVVTDTPAGTDAAPEATVEQNTASELDDYTDRTNVVAADELAITGLNAVWGVVIAVVLLIVGSAFIALKVIKAQDIKQNRYFTDEDENL